jgi:plasmid stabilization system protein ParE
MRGSPRPSRGQRLVVESTRPLDVSRALEYLDEALEEAEAAAWWYAERSSTAASGFADEIDAAIAAIEQNPEAWPSYDHGTRHYLFVDTRSASCIASRRRGFWWLPWPDGHRRPGYWASRLQDRPG